jgi:hypothetical protein
MHKAHAVLSPSAERTSWVLDDAWPETASMVQALARPDDQLLALGIVGEFPRRYAWPGKVERRARFATFRRHRAMRRVAKAPGGVRQRAYLEQDQAIARALARAIDYRSRHLIVAQSWLPWLGESGALGGRTFDVIMSRYPFGEIHRLLDAAAIQIGPSATIADFRADAGLVAREADLLAQARRIITPHHGIAGLFGNRALLLTWHKPDPMPREPASRVAFLGPTIARQRPDVARELARELPEPLIVFGSVIEALWDDTPIERRAMGPGWLDGIGAILHPATMTAQPRPLLEAVANGVTVYATEGCGLAPSNYLPIERFTERLASAA